MDKFPRAFHHDLNLCKLFISKVNNLKFSPSFLLCEIWGLHSLVHGGRGVGFVVEATPSDFAPAPSLCINKWKPLYYVYLGSFLFHALEIAFVRFIGHQAIPCKLRTIIFPLNINQK